MSNTFANGYALLVGVGNYGMDQTPFFDMAAEDFAVAMLRGGKGLPIQVSQAAGSEAPSGSPTGGAQKRSSAEDQSYVPGSSFAAAAAFISIKNLEKIAEGLDSYRAISALHRCIKAALNGDRHAGVRVLSALVGAVIIIPDKLQIDGSDILDNLLKSVFDNATAQGLPLRVGLSHGDLLPLKDIDDRFNFIGTRLNIAARLAVSSDNRGLLVHESFVNHLSASIDSTHYLSSNKRKKLSVKGKRDEVFICFSPPDDEWRANSEIKLISSEKVPDKQRVNAAIIAYDLPNFSDGDPLGLSQRFRSITDVFQQLALADKGFYFSPGGDGGIFMLPGMEKDKAYDIAWKFAKKLDAEGINKKESIWVNCRIGVHYGGVLLYENAEGLLRPAGSELFVADKIAGGAGKEGKRAPTIVFSEKLKESVGQGSDEYFRQNYEELLPPLNIFDGSVSRYTARYKSEDEQVLFSTRPTMQNADENINRIEQEGDEALELFEQLQPRDQLDRLMFRLAMPKEHQPAPTLTIAQRKNQILDHYAGIPNGLQKVIKELRDLIGKQGRP